MKNSILPNDGKGLAKELERLPSLKPAQLAERWRVLYGAEPPPRLRRGLMIQALAYRLQEQVLGGLKPATHPAPSQNCGGRGQPTASDRWTSQAFSSNRNRVRTRMARHQASGDRGQRRLHVPRQTLSITVQDRARITGTHWSGPLFFGLRRSGKEHQDGAR